MSEKKIDFIKGLSFLVSVLLVHFLFFGYICNLGLTPDLKEPGDRLLFVYLNFGTNLTWNFAGLFPPDWLIWIETIPGWLSIFILFLIGIYQAYSEEFLVYGIKNNILISRKILRRSLCLG